MGFDLEFLEALNRVTVESVAAGRLPAEAVLPGLRALDLWAEGPNGAMLFGSTGECMASASPDSTTSSKRVDGTWRLMGGASSTMEPWDDLLASFHRAFIASGEAPHPKGH